MYGVAKLLGSNAPVICGEWSIGIRNFALRAPAVLSCIEQETLQVILDRLTTEMSKINLMQEDQLATANANAIKIQVSLLIFRTLPPVLSCSMS